MSKKMGYIALIAVVLLFISIGSISATDTENTSSVDLSRDDSSSNIAIEENSEITQMNSEDSSSDDIKCATANSDLNDVNNLNEDSDSLKESDRKNKISENDNKVVPNATVIKATNTAVTVNTNQSFTVTLYDKNSNIKLAGQIISFKINGKIYNRTTNSKGVASLKFTNLSPGAYPITFTYAGNNYYKASSGKSTLTVNKIVSKISAYDFRQNYGDNKYYTIRLYSELANQLPKMQVTFTINGKTFIRTTNSKGRASIKINFNPGRYIIKIKFKGNSIYTAKTVRKNVVIFKNSTKLIRQTSNKIYVKGERFGLYLKDVKSVALPSRKVKINIGGVTYTRTTNSKGFVSIPLTKIGSFKVIYKYINATNSFMSSSGSCKINVIKNKTTLVANNHNLIDGERGMFSIRLLDAHSKPIAGKTILASLEGVIHHLTTNDNGYVYLNFTLKTGNYTVKYAYKDINPDLSSSGSKTITVWANRTYISGPNMAMVEGVSKDYSVTLYNQFKKVLPNKVITITVDNKTYSVKTNSKGIATQSLKLSKGNYTIKYEFAGDEKYPHANGTKTITVSSITNTFGVYLFGTNMKNINLKSVSSYHVGNIFLNYYAIEYWGLSEVKSFISKANSYGIKVHIWMQCFYNGGWVNPSTCGDSYKQKIINEAVSYAKIQGIGGIHLDYLRYPGTAYQYSGAVEQITTFTKNLVNAVKAVDKNLMISAAIMPETSSNAYYYGQDSSKLGNYLDVIMPMAYKGNYGQPSSWLKETASYFASHCGNAQIWLTLQSYRSDSDVTKLSVAELKKDSQNALDGGAKGVVFFRHQYTNYFDMDTLIIKSEKTSDTVTSTRDITSVSFTLSDIINASNTVKSYYVSNSKLPNTVKIGSVSVKMSEYLYYASLAIVNINNGDYSDIVALTDSIIEPANPNLGDDISSQLLYKDGYLDSANRTYKFILNYLQGPNYSTTTVGKVAFTQLVEAFARVISYYGENTALPNYVAINTVLTSSSSTGGADTSSITSLALSLTKNLSSEYSKAVTLFNWVRDNVKYSYYYNSQQGAVKTLKLKSGNCCDQSNLYVSLCRVINITVRYVHGNCHFSDGWYGHVWTEVYVNGKWYSADPISSRNTFGTINNWNTNTVTIYNRYTNLPF
ncbi:Ig-like domain repeat protein [uncultured Methanobrevibacter sp.]|uniref:Ig-like domain repeat protein n=1 Tax=uncultured Methanobrevibacter sp. TaxID=253161 RepID=UPI0025EE55B6|nr:Ig-like domain repeat protein [uncultured Methanobrevibacter sp.]